MSDSARILVVQVAALDHQLACQYPELHQATGLTFQPLVSAFPAVTCTAQASFRTASTPACHGMICNGLFARDLRSVVFWNQSAKLVTGPRIWDGFRARGGTVGCLFWQQALGEAVDMVLSPAPIHKHGGGMVQDCYAKPAGLYRDLCGALGRSFKLSSYWGPLASWKSTRWIADAVAEVIKRPAAPDLILTYLPHLDYVLQKQGRNGPGVPRAVARLATALGALCRHARQNGYRILLWGDYAIADAEIPVYPNRILREAGFLHTRPVGKRRYPDLWCSDAFAMVDHQIAHVYVQTPERVAAVAACLSHVPGIAEVRQAASLPHPHSGELILVAEPNAWFAYPWWERPAEAPDYATHVDIHNKIGFDPCELFFGGLFPPGISQDARRVRGTHGRTDMPACFASDLPFTPAPADLVELAAALGRHLDSSPPR